MFLSYLERPQLWAPFQLPSPTPHVAFIAWLGMAPMWFPQLQSHFHQAKAQPNTQTWLPTRSAGTFETVHPRPSALAVAMDQATLEVWMGENPSLHQEILDLGHCRDHMTKDMFVKRGHINSDRQYQLFGVDSWNMLKGNLSSYCMVNYVHSRFKWSFFPSSIPIYPTIYMYAHLLHVCTSKNINKYICVYTFTYIFNHIYNIIIHMQLRRGLSCKLVYNVYNRC